MFGDTAARAEPAEPEGGGDISPEPTWDIDVRSYETHKRVEYYLARFKGPVRPTFTEWLSRGTRYEPMIRTKLQAAGLPGDLTYLALIESGYNPHAYSRAAAVGMWQMMTATAKGMGLRVDWWIDERRDPVRSTDGAIRFLTYLHEQFGSLYLAAAAYNGGPGRVARGLSRYADQLEGSTGEDRFFALAEHSYLRAETRDYVPKMIAAALIAKDPRRYGITVESRSVLEYDTVRVGPATPLAAIAKATGVSIDAIRDLNPHILRGVTPPKGSLSVRVPAGIVRPLRQRLRGASRGGPHGLHAHNDEEGSDDGLHGASRRDHDEAAQVVQPEAQGDEERHAPIGQRRAAPVPRGRDWRVRRSGPGDRALRHRPPHARRAQGRITRPHRQALQDVGEDAHAAEWAEEERDLSGAGHCGETADDC